MSVYKYKLKPFLQLWNMLNTSTSSRRCSVNDEVVPAITQYNRKNSGHRRLNAWSALGRACDFSAISF